MGRIWKGKCILTHLWGGWVSRLEMHFGFQCFANNNVVCIEMILSLSIPVSLIVYFGCQVFLYLCCPAVCNRKRLHLLPPFNYFFGGLLILKFIAMPCIVLSTKASIFLNSSELFGIIVFCKKISKLGWVSFLFPPFFLSGGWLVVVCNFGIFLAVSVI